MILSSLLGVGRLLGTRGSSVAHDDCADSNHISAGYFGYLLYRLVARPNKRLASTSRFPPSACLAYALSYNPCIDRCTNTKALHFYHPSATPFPVRLLSPF